MIKLNRYSKCRWFVKFPLSLYVEDVKKIATDNGLIIVDKLYENDSTLSKLKAIKVPSITLKTEVKTKEHIKQSRKKKSFKVGKAND